MANDDVKNFYNDTMPGKFGDDYEQKRWFSDPTQKAGFYLTLRAISRHVLSDERLDPARVLELGPGAGTWTKFLVKRFPGAYFDLVDISREMLDRARAALPGEENIRFVEADILDFAPEGHYDYFFSSRVLEYIGDKKKFCEKIFSALDGGGRGFLITKMPHYRRERFLGRRSSNLHQGQISPGALIDALRRAGFSDVVAYPVTTSIPLFHSPRLNVLLGKFFGKFTLNPVSVFFAESYCVLFRKPSET